MIIKLTALSDDGRSVYIAANHIRAFTRINAALPHASTIIDVSAPEVWTVRETPEQIIELMSRDV